MTLDKRSRVHYNVLRKEAFMRVNGCGVLYSIHFANVKGRSRPFAKFAVQNEFQGMKAPSQLGLDVLFKKQLYNMVRELCMGEGHTSTTARIGGDLGMKYALRKYDKAIMPQFYIIAENMDIEHECPRCGRINVAKRKNATRHAKTSTQEEPSCRTNPKE